MIDVLIDICYHARNDEALAWIYLVDAEAIYLTMSKEDQKANFEGLEDIRFVAETMTELRKEKCK